MFCGAKLLKIFDVRKCARHFSSFPSIFPHFRTPTQARELYAYLSKAGAKVQKKMHIRKKNLHISKKSSTFAADFVTKRKKC